MAGVRAFLQLAFVYVLPFLHSGTLRIQAETTNEKRTPINSLRRAHSLRRVHSHRTEVINPPMVTRSSAEGDADVAAITVATAY
jgi:hypothetical protein